MTIKIAVVENCGNCNCYTQTSHEEEPHCSITSAPVAEMGIPEDCPLDDFTPPE